MNAPAAEGGPRKRVLLPEDPRSIVLVRLTARGDVLFSAPVARALRKRYPNTTLTWVVEAHTQAMIRGHPDLDEVIVWDKARWKELLRRGELRTLWRELLEFRRRLRALRADVAIDLQGLLRSGAVAYLTGAPVRIGVGSKEGSRLLMTDLIPRFGNVPGGVAGQYPYVAECLGLDASDFRLLLSLGDDELKYPRALVEEHGLERGYAVLGPFTTRDHKHWLEERWGEVADRVREELGLPVVLVGGPEDREAAERIRGHASTEIVDLVGKTSLAEANAVVHDAALYVGVDTSLTHVAMTFRRPAVALFGSNIPYTEPPNGTGRILLHLWHCAPCGRRPTCGGEHWCMRAITVDEVLRAARAALEEERAGVGER